MLGAIQAMSFHQPHRSSRRLPGATRTACPSSACAALPPPLPLPLLLLSSFASDRNDDGGDGSNSLHDFSSH